MWGGVTLARPCVVSWLHSQGCAAMSLSDKLGRWFCEWGRAVPGAGVCECSVKVSVDQVTRDQQLACSYVAYEPPKETLPTAPPLLHTHLT